ncbi:Hypothetical protein NTJ_11022 [Nesidiocoris tenuis]|uniref:Uncharacterized protein n=1 Tax=Nesidiocoris tenuis TaxID=355587 RepID=A0ABN7B4X1_9HEMI|nr:Hypothetical protein NTJ_11022 [Nesidiocoris tenuis]
MDEMRSKRVARSDDSESNHLKFDRVRSRPSLVNRRSSHCADGSGSCCTGLHAHGKARPRKRRRLPNDVAQSLTNVARNDSDGGFTRNNPLTVRQ